MKRVLTLIFFFAVFALINGPPVYSMNDVDDISIETVDSYELPSITSDLTIQPVCILPGGLDLKLPTQEVYTYVEITETFWLCSSLNDIHNISTDETTRLNDQSPDVDTLALNTTIMGHTRLDIGESDMDRHFRTTYV